jgi:hypothetical protein
MAFSRFGVYDIPAEADGQYDAKSNLPSEDERREW